jgi:hypothetical protein
MSEPLADISVVDLDLGKTTWSRVHSSMRTLFLRLSREPDLAWVRFFHEERESRVVARRHGLWIEDGFIVFDCMLADVESEHLPDLRRSIAYANEKCRELSTRQAQEVTRRRRDERAENDRLATLRAHIRSQAGDDVVPPTSAAASPPAAPAAAAAAAADAPDEFEIRRNEWRARFRRALRIRNQEPDRGNE